MLTNLNQYILAEKFNINPLMPFFTNIKTCNCKMELIRLRSNEVKLRTIKDKEELVVVVGGSGGIVIDGEGATIKAGDLIYIPRNTIRSVANINEDELLQIVWITLG